MHVRNLLKRRALHSELIGTAVAPRDRVNWGSDATAIPLLEDGLGTRRLETDASGATVEVLTVSANLAAESAFEDAVRTSAERLSIAAIEGIAGVRRVEREGATLRVVADHVEGLRLPDFLREAIKGNIPLPQPAALELAGRMLRVVAALHQVPGMSHGAITAAHVVITRTGGVVLTDAAFGPALEGLQRNREQLWREFRVALPASASLPRFDQRADVAQLGATVLAIALGRPLRESEYPRAINAAVFAATLAARHGESGTSASGLRMWLQEALHLHPRASFASAVDAHNAYADTLGRLAARRGGTEIFESSVRMIFGDTAASAEAAELAAAWSQPTVVHHVPQAVAPMPPVYRAPLPPAARVEGTGAFSSILRYVFPLFRTS
jgi:hypothetical protein